MGPQDALDWSRVAVHVVTAISVGVAVVGRVVRGLKRQNEAIDYISGACKRLLERQGLDSDQPPRPRLSSHVGLDEPFDWEKVEREAKKR
jgi:hypothetical protein